jgi:hypothetical protein
MGFRERVNERMVSTSYMLGNLRVRAWIACDHEWLPTLEDAQTQINAKLTFAHRDGISDPIALAEYISQLDNVNAVEVLRPDGNGAIIYPHWP